MLAAKSALLTSFTTSALPSAPMSTIGSAYAPTVSRAARDVVGRAAEHHREVAGEHVVGAAAERGVDHVAVARVGDAPDRRRATRWCARHEEGVGAQVPPTSPPSPEGDLGQLLVGVEGEVDRPRRRWAASARESVTAAPSRAKCSRTSARRA